ncbi:MAG: hypothetical protein PHO87_04890, partial [Acholeplasmataceae bacterium]|nr:hypothetical protein [Acholeplasmataceae bacterium]
MINPYNGINWANINYIQSVSHAHLLEDDHLTNAYNEGIRHFAISNYYPAQPWHPLGDCFTSPPVDAVSCPNAEHSNMIGVLGVGSLHSCSIGSTYVSQNGVDGVYITWADYITSAINNMIYEGGGGIIINHPYITGLKITDICKMLDFSTAVLGIEIYNHSSEVGFTQGWSLTHWDSILKTGRQCYGFCVPDHEARSGSWLGRNVLIVPNVTELACAVAYRNGQFYGAMTGTGCKFISIMATNEKVTVVTDTANEIKFITQFGTVKTVANTSGEYVLNGSETYVRIEAIDMTGERIFSQPI